MDACWPGLFLLEGLYPGRWWYKPGRPIPVGCNGCRWNLVGLGFIFRLAEAEEEEEEEEEEAEEVIRQVMSATASVWPPRSSGDEHGPRMDHTVVLSAIFLAFLLYFNTLKADFAYDDRFVHLSYPLMGGFLDDLIGWWLARLCAVSSSLHHWLLLMLLWRWLAFWRLDFCLFWGEWIVTLSPTYETTPKTEISFFLSFFFSLRLDIFLENIWIWVFGLLLRGGGGGGGGNWDGIKMRESQVHPRFSRLWNSGGARGRSHAPFDTPTLDRNQNRNKFHFTPNYGRKKKTFLISLKKKRKKIFLKLYSTVFRLFHLLNPTPPLLLLLLPANITRWNWHQKKCVSKCRCGVINGHMIGRVKRGRSVAVYDMTGWGHAENSSNPPGAYRMF